MSAYQYLEIVDLSATGAKLQGQSLPPPGKTALLRLEGHQTMCRVVWVGDGMCGVHFETIIPLAVLADFRNAASPAKAAIASNDESR